MFARYDLAINFNHLQLTILNKMDLASLLIGIGLLAIFLLPVFLIHRANKRSSASKPEGLEKQG
jgi:hypothetical protein